MVALRVHPDALAEFAEAVAFYEHRAPGLGRDFFEEVRRAWHVVQDNPDLAPLLEDPYRRFLCRRFPFSIIYRAT